VKVNFPCAYYASRLEDASGDEVNLGITQSAYIGYGIEAQQSIFGEDIFFLVSTSIPAPTTETYSSGIM
jgi:hypothetical protein